MRWIADRWSYWLAAVLLIALAASGGTEPVAILVRAYFERSLREVPLPDHPKPRDEAEADRQDLDDLTELLRRDRSFSAAARNEFATGLDALRARAGTLSRAEFAMNVARLVALAGNGHTSVSGWQRARRFGRVPLRFAWFADGLYVVRTAPGEADLLGARIVAIDGRPVEAALSAVAPYLSGTMERARADSSPILESPELLQAIWPETDGAHLALRLELQAGGTVDRTLERLGPMPDPFAEQPIMVIGPKSLPNEGVLWKSAAPDRIPMSLVQPDRAVYSQDLEQGGIYVRINDNVGDADGPLASQLAPILARAPADGWRWIVLDLRFNHGGDYLQSAAFTRALPHVLAPDGALWIVTGNWTFSAAIIDAARAKHFVGRRAHIVGEKVGDHDSFWAEGGPALILRNSGIAIQYATFEHNWVNGCRSPVRCFPLNLVYGVAAGDLSPEIAIGWRFADYAAGRDTVLEAIRARAMASGPARTWP